MCVLLVLFSFPRRAQAWSVIIALFGILCDKVQLGNTPLSLTLAS